jgi:hypothetical protein
MGVKSRIAGVTVAALLASAALIAPTTARAAEPAVSARQFAPASDAAPAPIAATPYLGWSSWSLQSTNYPGVNVDGPGSWISAQHIMEQADAMAAKLKSSGYEYVNIDALWSNGADQYGRPLANVTRFPNGIAPVADHVHGLGLKLGIYAVVGLEMDAYRNGTTPIYGAPGCTTKDIVYPDLRTTNGWDMSYKIDYSNPCSQQYANSIASLFASWGVDFVKMDGVGPGSFKGGPNYDNTADIKAWSGALKATGRPIQYVVSWALSHRQADVWKANTNGWRIDTDVECYCGTLVKWDQSVRQRWNDVVQWTGDAAPGHWNNLDALDVGNGAMDGLTDAERQSYATFWAIEKAPLFSGDDLTKLDAYGLSLLTNRDVIAIDQAGVPAKPVSQKSLQQVWHTPNADGSVTVALFNLGDAPARVTATLSDVGISGRASVRDVWRGVDTGTVSDTVGATLPAHGSQLLTITPAKAKVAATPTDVRATAVTSTSVDLAWSPSTSAGSTEYRVSVNRREVARTTGTTATVGGLTAGKPYELTVTAVVDGSKQSGASTPLSLTTPQAGRVLYEAEAPTNTLVGTASIVDCASCSGGKKVGNLGGDSSMTFTSVTAPAEGNYLMTIAYIDGDASRQGTFTVNGIPQFGVNFSGSNDNDWGTPQAQNIMVHLKAGVNSITIGQPNESVSDIDSITV